MVASAFFSVYNMAIDTVFLSFLEDSERNDGSPEKPYYMNKSLRKILGKKNKKNSDSEWKDCDCGQIISDQISDTRLSKWLLLFSMRRIYIRTCFWLIEERGIGNCIKEYNRFYVVPLFSEAIFYSWWNSQNPLCSARCFKWMLLLLIDTKLGCFSLWRLARVKQLFTGISWQFWHKFFTWSKLTFTLLSARESFWTLMCYRFPLPGILVL